ncbi:tRNA 2-selenouridine(34) synthase MnmH [Ancylomarina euxinus]|uniref:tRNA 2-selenouridine(34) synthase MnmH n=1 Tax=Ancylomarina euxinus TaxID=2283627 RepID=A0A425Y7Z9_9BACT|nr:tRNA 2-selenouridine(34) synthase MnmH [Ancylomarina euxinus]MCZ4693494.1 tRNA 2-selenouridine(34) synthase MnmH [Ancylomarina euxinus]MUP13721.1 tRNA 2-selenouridine(34) synthase MnmH [Ancylomarina euxinus]RRG24641.1 tRNA 2-selenouridine(34) synthase MnmH [Ancylomarina euxinus]
MVIKLSAQDFLEKGKTIPMIDVRTPAEFEQGHIPGAVNIPIFTNEERAQVGTKYKRSSKDAAVLLGLELVGPKLSVFVKRAKKIAVNGEVLIHCWRGGMRSGSMAWLFETAGLKPSLLVGGYKAYRHYIRESFSWPTNLVVIGGYTGSGKTEVLHKLSDLGEQVLDLEGIANHKGSAFGALGQDDQPTTEHFENLLGQAWLEFDHSKPIWTEDESHAVGSVWINDPLFAQMRKAPLLAIIVPKSERIKRLVKEYACFDIDLLKQMCKKIEKRLGGLKVKKAFDSLELGDYATVADITLDYYDKAYGHGLDTRTTQEVYRIEIEKDEPEQNARYLIEYLQKLK